jgi:serine/threonine protein kinase
VVGLLRCFETPDAYHLVFEEGEAWSEDLPSLLGNGWNAQEIAKGLIFGLLRGLEALHAQGVVHKDLRAEHILVSNRDGAVTVRLSSHWAELPPSTPSMKKVIGSDGLQAPEVYRGEVCYASDCFAAGILWFLLIENRDPFPAECFATLRPGLFPGSAPMVAAAEAIEAHALAFSDQLWDPRAASLCTRLLCVDPVMRTTAAEALVDPYFADGE